MKMKIGIFLLVMVLALLTASVASSCTVASTADLSPPALVADNATTTIPSYADITDKVSDVTICNSMMTRYDGSPPLTKKSDALMMTAQVGSHEEPEEVVSTACSKPVNVRFAIAYNTAEMISVYRAGPTFAIYNVIGQSEFAMVLLKKPMITANVAYGELVASNVWQSNVGYMNRQNEMKVARMNGRSSPHAAAVISRYDYPNPFA